MSTKREKYLVDEKGKQNMSTKREKYLVDEMRLIKGVSMKWEDTKKKRAARNRKGKRSVHHRQIWWEKGKEEICNHLDCHTVYLFSEAVRDEKKQIGAIASHR